MGVNVIGLFLKSVLRATATAIAGPWRLFGELYNVFAKGARYTWVEWLYLVATAITLGHVTWVWVNEGFFMAVFAWLMLALTVLLILDVASRMIEHIPDDGAAGELLGWLKWMPGAHGTYKPRMAPVNQHGKKYVRGASLMDGAAVAAQQAATDENYRESIKIGGVAIAQQNEAEHFLIAGKTGAGKSQAINEMLRTVQSRGQTAIIADPSGGYFDRFGRDGDLLLNPFDARSVDWSPFKEIDNPEDVPMVVMAAIPKGSDPADESWSGKARTFLQELILLQWREGNYSLKELLRRANQATDKELYNLLKDTPAATYVVPGADRLLASIRSQMTEYLSAWDYLPDMGSFSVREWVRNVDQDARQGWLYITYMDNQMETLKRLVGCWLGLAITEGLCLRENPERRLWYIMDELDSLGKVSSLSLGLTRLRKNGGCCVSGLQTIAQLRATYGKDQAQTLLSCMSNKLLLAAGDSETAEYFSREIGDQEFQRENKSKGQSGKIGEMANASKNVSTEHRTERAVLASEITALPNLHGYLKPVGSPAMRVTLEYVRMESLNIPFTRKEKEAVAHG